MAYSFWGLGGLGLVVGASLFGVACTDTDPAVVEDPAGAGGDDSEPGAGGIGGDPSGRGGVGGDEPEPEPAPVVPLYGESGTTPESLRLTFQKISVPGAGSTTDFVFLPDDDADLSTSSLLHLNRNNEMRLVDLEAGVATVRETWDVGSGYTGEACPTTNVLLDPDFDSNRFIYITKCTDDVKVTQLLRYEWDEENGPTSPAVIFATTHWSATEGWHRYGSMGWEPDGVLWMLVGDHDTEGNTAQNPKNALGSLVRLIPNRDPEGDGHTAADGNWAQLSGDADIDPTVFAFGLRSPWRGTRDSRGRIWFGDVGHNTVEEINLATEAGQNFAWADLEGPCETGCRRFTDPLIHYVHADETYVDEEPGAGGSSQRSIWMGQIYENPAADRYEGLMDGVVPYGDLFVGFVRGARANNKNELTMNDPIGLLFNVTTWKMGADGYAYAGDLFGDLHVAVLDYQ